MRRSSSLLLAGLALVWSSLPVQAQEDDLKALVAKAVKAHGGKDVVAKYRGSQVKYKGAVEVGGNEFKVDGEIFHNYPDRMKNVINVDANGMKIAIEQGYDGKVLWMTVLGKTDVIKDKEALTEIAEQLHAEQVTNLIGLDGKEYKFNSLGEAKVKDKPALGVRVSKEGKRDVILWLDKTSHLVVKSERRGKDPFMLAEEVNQETYYSDYKDVMGRKFPGRMEAYRDGKKLAELEIGETRLHEKLDDTQFAKP